MKITAPAKYGGSAALAAQRYRKVTIKILHAKLHVIDLYLHILYLFLNPIKQNLNISAVESPYINNLRHSCNII